MSESISGELIARLQIKVGSVYIALNKFEEAFSAVQTGLAYLPEGDSQYRISSLINLGLLHSLQGKFDQARVYYQEGLEMSQRLRDDFRALKIRGNMAIDQEISGDWKGALVEHQEELNLAEKLGSATEQVKLHNNLGILNTNIGDFEKAREHLYKALELVNKHELGESEPYVLTSMIDLNLREMKWESAGSLLSVAERLIEEKEIGLLKPYILIYRCLLQLGINQPIEALQTAQSAVENAITQELDFEKGLALRVLGQAYTQNRELDLAVEAFANSYELLSGDPYEAARTQVSWANTLVDTQPGKAKDIFESAKGEFEKLGASRDLLNVVSVIQEKF